MTSGLRTAFPPWPNMAVPDLREKPRRPVSSTFSPPLRGVCFQLKTSLLHTFEPRLFGGAALSARPSCFCPAAETTPGRNCRSGGKRSSTVEYQK